MNLSAFKLKKSQPKMKIIHTTVIQAVLFLQNFTHHIFHDIHAFLANKGRIEAIFR